MTMTTVAAIQMAMTQDVQENIQTADRLVRQAAAQGANIILLPELFERPYFCQERQYEYYDYATPVGENAAVCHFQTVAKELNVVLPISFYEKDGNRLFNSVAMIDGDGAVLGVYRKTHIPDDHYYQEKFYFIPGDTGFTLWDTCHGRIGVGICWDQWFPETARALALQGAEFLLYPTAIGSEPILTCDSMLHWQRAMTGHAACNLIPVVAANRVGTEQVTSSRKNGRQSSALVFYGSSFITDETGAVLTQAPREGEGVLTASFDREELAKQRLAWGLFRDRRPSCYQIICQK